RQHRSKEAACRDVLRDLLRRPRVSVVAALFDHFEEQSGRMPGSQVLRAESLLHAAVVDAVPIEMLLPERTGARRNRVAGARELARAGAARLARVGKTGGDGADVGVAVPVIEVVDRDVAVHQDGLLHQPLCENRGEEIDILLRAAGAQRDVVNVLNQALHSSSSSARINAAPRTMAVSFAKATSRVRYFMPQSGATISRSAGTYGSARRIRSATCSADSTSPVDRSRTPSTTVLPARPASTEQSSADCAVSTETCRTVVAASSGRKSYRAGFPFTIAP